MKTIHISAVGNRHGLWTIIGDKVMVGRLQQYHCRCDCGTVRFVIPADLCTGRSTNCGCVRRKKVGARNFKHGLTHTREYIAWAGMLARCSNPKHVCYHNYGGRGITVCKRWRESFTTFITDMGMPPSPKHQVDRIDNNGNYEPGNCRWVTNAQNAQNTRKNVFIECNGERLCLSEWARRIGISIESLRGRLSSGWSEQEAVTTPPLGTGKTRKKRQSPAPI